MFDREKLLRRLRRVSEFLFIPAAIVLWIFSAPLIRALDPTAATYDGGIFQIIVFTIIQAGFYLGITWLIMIIRFPGVYDFLDKSFRETFKNKLTSWQKSKLSFSVFFALLLFFALLSRVI